MSADSVDAGAVRDACDRLREVGPALATRGWRELAGLLGRVGGRFLDPGDPLRREALDRLPEDAGISPELAEDVLDGMARDWTTERLIRLVQEEFADPACLDGFTRGRAGSVRASDGVGERELMAFGPSLCVQIVSGSVPGVGVNALLRSLLLKAPTLVKPGRGDVLLTRLFARGLDEADVEVGGALAVLYWPGTDSEVTREAIEQADVVTLYGSDATLGAVRAMAPPTTRVVGYHHREGVAIIGRDDLSGERADDAALGTARAVAIFDQRGCVCPRLVYVERGGDVGPAEFAGKLADALRQIEGQWPTPALPPEESVAIQQLRGVAELAAATGSGELWHGGPDASWTVVYEEEEVPAAPPVTGRGIRVRPIGDASELPALLEPLGPHLQSVGHAGFGARLDPLVVALGRMGASRVVPLGSMSFPDAWWLHDGRGPLRELVRWVEVER